jgi:hypothetical protein
MKNTSRILLFLVPALLAGMLCHADPLNGGITNSDVVALLLIILAIALVFAAAPVVSYLSYKRQGRQLNITAWVLAIITKLACIVFATRSGNNNYWQWGALAGILPNISLCLLLLKAERNLHGWQFQLASFVHSILGILVADILLSLVLSRFIILGDVRIYQAFSGLLRFAITVGFVYQYLKSAAAKAVGFAPGLLRPFVFGLAITLGLFMNNMLMLLLVEVQSDHVFQSGITNIVFSMQHENIFLLANALLSGVAAYWLFNQKTKNAG